MNRAGSTQDTIFVDDDQKKSFKYANGNSMKNKDDLFGVDNFVDELKNIINNVR